MLSTVAGLRRYAVAALACVALVPFANARDQILFTSSVSYCEPPELVLVQQFDIIYFAANQSIFFNVSAASVQDNVNVTANLLVNVYGLKPINITIDLCNILSGALCPLPTYNFTGSETLPLPSSVDVASRVPSIAYSIPDLEAFAQLTLTSVDTNEVKACVQSTLANGWSTRQTAVQWSTGGILILAFASALLHSLLCSPESRAPFRFLDLFGLYQSIAASALLGLNYPVVYRMFASNFSWALGLFKADNDSHIQNSINNMRRLTGGNMDSSGSSGVELVNRKLSPYNDVSKATLAIRSLQSKMSASFFARSTGALTKRDGSTVTLTTTNVLDAGIPVWVNSLGITTQNAFMSVFFTLLILIAIVTIVAFLPVTIFALNQWTLDDSWLATLLSVITLLAVLVAIAYPTYTTIRLVRRERPWLLYRDTPHIMSSGPLYIQYRHQRWFFFITSLTAIFVRAVVIGFGHNSGLTQLIILSITELTVLLSILMLKPHETRGGDVLASTLASARVLATGLCFAFVESFNVAPIPRVVIGFVILVVFSFAVILMIINTVVNLGLFTLWREHILARFGTRIGSSLRSNSRTGSTKGSLPDLQGADRPRNPTPHHNIPLDPSVIQAYPQITPTASSSYHESPYPSTQPSPGMTSESGVGSYGSVLPRRPSHEGLGLDGLTIEERDLEEGGAAHYSPAVTHYSSSQSTPSTPHSGGSQRGSRRESWTPAAALPRMSEATEVPAELETINDQEQEERQRSPRT
ncbi:hypothetical protein EW145_g5276 [Phellinidium pouzarii]|uniref:ML-like domain-containing protein n=1 Tax=Phellinidium pouzarii TaxID=167371 RepID=A0A4S4L1W9_9AGAM|nr:hypothetical protein EW145_g5276 [Phellinidium pouzarii]